MLDADLLYDYIHRFFGYGSFAAKYWFIGLEEGGVSDIAQLEARLNVWDAAGRPSLADPREFHARLAGIDWFRSEPPLQATWRPLMRVRYAAQGLSAGASELKRYQSQRLASTDGDTALLELLPLPARGRSASEPWIYDRLELPELASRKTYERAFTDKRRGGIINMIDEHQPAAVVTYGQAAEWRNALNANERVNAKAWAGRRGAAVVVCTHHPGGARPNAHWDEIGRFIASAVQ